MVPLIDAVFEPWAIGTPPLGPPRPTCTTTSRSPQRRSSRPLSRRRGPRILGWGSRARAEARPATALLAAAEDADLLAWARAVAAASPACSRPVSAQCPPRTVPRGGRSRRTSLLGSVLSPRRVCGVRWRGEASPEGWRHEHRRHTAKHSPRRGEGHPEDLRHRSGQGARSERGEPLGRPRRDGGDHGAKRLRQDDAQSPPGSMRSTPETC